MSRYISNALKEKIRQQAKFRCGYCLRSELLIGMPMEFEHLIPLALGGQTVEENLWLSCRRCNEFKGIQIQGFDLEISENAPLFNPRIQVWSEHFSWNIDGTEVIGITPIGRVTVNALNLNEGIIVVTRHLWVSVGWFPPED